MSSLGVVILAHNHLDRVISATKIWAESHIPVEIHIDAKVPTVDFAPLQDMATRSQSLGITPRRECEWGRWSIVQATISATQRILAQNPKVSHVMLCSGSCILLRPPSELLAFLKNNKNVDFIESFRTDLVDSGPDGLSQERLTLHHPISWKRFPRSFNFSVNVQRSLGVTRHLPAGIVPHMGSQWWCLTRATLEYIFNDPDQKKIERLYKGSWIPDEGYFQTQARRWSTNISGQSLTYSHFDKQGKPRVFYNDHADALERSAVFVARKIWHGANHLYERFPKARGCQNPDHALLDYELKDAVRSRPVVQTCSPTKSAKPANPLYIFCGFEELWPEFTKWANSGDHRIAQSLFAPKTAAAWASKFPSAHKKSLVVSLLQRHQAKKSISGILIQAQDLLDIGHSWAHDPNISVELISGSWLSQHPDPSTAAQLQRAELAWINELHKASAQFNVTTLGDALANPNDVLRPIAKTLALNKNVSLPQLRIHSGMSETLQNLRVAGLAPKVFGPLHMVYAPSGPAYIPTAVP
ncbi:MAG: beta-1,6-N-acetylglucosaminyltransferase [Pseudoprimorskyibacter sp.]|nr:beta-1,6-N-acetylglucosaminyltransferase [Pseudoprimorskyibacter sp.]